jgi:hypothetical protein
MQRIDQPAGGTEFMVLECVSMVVNSNLAGLGWGDRQDKSSVNYNIGYSCMKYKQMDILLLG